VTAPFVLSPSAVWRAVSREHRSPKQLWEFLIEGDDARSRVPESRFNISAYHSPDKKPGATNTEFGYFLDESVDLGALDMSFFSVPRNGAARLDLAWRLIPQMELLLEYSRS
jgi:acyl transferase domain-containing protein